jgi:integron integrase
VDQQERPLLTRVRDAARVRGYSEATGDTYAYWVKRFVLFHGKCHPTEMAESEVEAFLTHLARGQGVASSTQNQAFAALLFLYKHVLGMPLKEQIQSVRAKTGRNNPTVLSTEEIGRLLAQMTGTTQLMAQLTYGAGLRLREVHTLRVGDLDFQAKRVHVRDGKGQKDRSTLMPATLIPALREHLARVNALHTEDLALGHGNAVLPHAFHRKSPTASQQFRWQFLFPSRRIATDERTGLSGRWYSSPERCSKRYGGRPNVPASCAESPFML